MTTDLVTGALLALWNDVTPEREALYNDWHANEHVPERLTVPGMLWAARFVETAAAPTGARYLTLYGMRDAQVLASEPYVRLLREPTPMSRRMRPELRNVTRWVCAVRDHSGAPNGAHLTVWLLPSLACDEAATARNTVSHRPAVRGWLLADRLADAAPLPWVGVDQQGQCGIVGGAMLCAAFDSTPPTDPVPGHPLWYRQLPVRAG